MNGSYQQRRTNGMFSPQLNAIFIKYQNDSYELLWTMIHELFHKKDSVTYAKRFANIKTYESFAAMESKIFKPKVYEFIKEGVDLSEISRYASSSFFKGKYDEVYTEIRTAKLMGRKKGK